ncbi:winged helix DNA-binding domain-containing protein [Streptosporangium sp. NBC_01755]|uniref:winged helix DNA-binding domain-containing protein n=1 Tax=unclassified Streptosporangium TaxID=2632669 RepID=UPI002DD88098|nr:MULTISPECIES: winged helix DNA-binding domain-containing protein [unclassified Streptosporangium]WSA28871.1 winged helix DNA-binding domain-containing protein [Streptosporangium sp. NBC_01810]WSC99683.1 winged helix DNA-binding domain-containing protein [Streptosporangium sp. NBC_01755]
MPEVLSRRALNRATLGRQLLLARAELPALEAVRRLYGMQAQAPNPPYIGLWARLAGFTHDDLARLINERLVVRLALMRSTIHLVTADDCLALRPMLGPLLARGLRGTHGKGLAGVDLDELAVVGRKLVEERPLTFRELGAALRERWPDSPAEALAAGVRNTLALVQVPPRGIWGVGGQATHTTAEAWLGRPQDERPSAEEVIRRYLAAYGPATVMDVQQWSGMTRLGEVVRGMGLRNFATEDGAELFDLPEAPRPGAETPAPVRYLSEFDNMLLSFAPRTRTRITEEEYRGRIFTVNGIIKATVLVDGFVRGIWKVTGKRDGAVLEVELFAQVSEGERAALEVEGARLLDFVAPEASSRAVRFREA